MLLLMISRAVLVVLGHQPCCLASKLSHQMYRTCSVCLVRLPRGQSSVKAATDISKCQRPAWDHISQWGPNTIPYPSATSQALIQQHIVPRHTVLPAFPLYKESFSVTGQSAPSGCVLPVPRLDEH